jgi:hypothetical protein
VVDKPCKIRAVSTNVEDRDGSALYMSIYHLVPGPNPMADASSVLPVGSVLAIKVGCGWCGSQALDSISVLKPLL